MLQFALSDVLLGVDPPQEVLASLGEVDHGAAVLHLNLANVFQDADLKGRGGSVSCRGGGERARAARRGSRHYKYRNVSLLGRHQVLLVVGGMTKVCQKGGVALIKPAVALPFGLLPL